MGECSKKNITKRKNNIIKIIFTIIYIEKEILIMISFKQWQIVNESLMGSIPIGLGNPQNLGVVSNLGLDESKAKKKKMEDDAEEVDNEDDGETGDGEVVEPKSPKDNVKVSVEDDDDGEDEEMDMEKCGCGGKCGKCAKKKAKKNSKKKCGSDENKAMDLKSNEDEDENSGKSDENKAKDLEGTEFAKKKAKKKMKEAYLDTDDEWMTSLKNMMDVSNTTQKFSSGLEGLFTPVDELTQAIRKEPTAGEVGFAPTVRVGGALGGSFEEWVKNK